MPDPALPEKGAPAPGLAIFTIYERPLDYPNSYVLRCFWILPGEPAPVPDHVVMLAGDPATLREYPASLGLTLLPRSPADDPAILESWI